MKFSGFLLALLLGGLAGGADFSIVLPEDAARPEQTAAAELQEHLAGVTGKRVTVVAKAPTDGGKIIYLRPTGGKIDFDRYGSEEYLVRAVSESELIIGGGRPRGTLYGVLEFCERELGVEWLDPDYTHIPVRPDYRWKTGLELKGRPGFDYRNAEPYVGTNPDGKVARFMLRSRNNSFIYLKYDDLAAAYGVYRECGSPGTSHTFQHYTEKWGEAEKEAMAWYQGERIKSGGGEKPGQVCLSSPLARRLFVEKLRGYIAADRAGKPREEWPVIYEISQNDTRWGWCECDGCRALEERYAARSGVLLDFINAIAGSIAGDDPEILIRTFAYGSTLDAPTGIAAGPNVCIRYAQPSAEIGSVIWDGRKRDSMRSFAHPNNRVSRERMEKWAATGCSFAVWDYWGLYGGKGKWPTVNIRTIMDNIAFYRRLKAKMMLAETANVDLGSFHPLRIWIGNQAMNHPDLDGEKALARFFSGYYGPAAAPMRELLELIQAANDRVPGAIGVLAAKDRPDFTPEFFQRAEALLNAAEKAAGDDDRLLFRIRRERAPFDRARLDLIGQLPLPEAELEKVLERYERGHKMLCTPQYMGRTRGRRMMGNIDSYVQGIRLLNEKTPLPELAGREIVAEYLWKDITTLGEGAAYAVLHDPEAAGRTCLAIDQRLSFYGKAALAAGVYDPVAKRSLATLRIPNGKLPKDEKFHLYHLGRMKLPPQSYFWAHPSWGFSVNLSSLNRSGADGIVDVYFSTKVQGPTYVPASTQTTFYKFDRLILLKPQLRAIPVNGRFDANAAGDAPKGWKRNGWKGYHPFAGHGLRNGVFHLARTTAPDGFEWQSPLFPAVAGEKILVTAEVKGSGRCGLRFQYYDAAGRWTGISRQVSWQRLTDDWHGISAELTVADQPDKAATGKVGISLVGEKDHELFIRDFAAFR